MFMLWIKDMLSCREHRREIFSQVGTLKEHGLDVPQITLLADLLRQSGLDIPLGVLTREELVDAIMKIAG